MPTPKGKPPLDWTRVEALFDALLELPPEARADALRQATLGAEEVRREVELLLSSASRLSQFLETPLADRVYHASPAENPHALPLGTELGEFRLLSILGRGGVATVYLARQQTLDRLVALKISRDVGEEARTIARLEHDHIVKVHAQAAWNGLRLISMQYVPGVALDRWTPGEDDLVRLARESASEVTSAVTHAAERVLPEGFDRVATALWIGAKIAEALDYAHRRGVLHLDVKPSNILIHVSGKPLLTDFNVSRSERNPHRGQFLGGTEGYMPPEQERLWDLPPEQWESASSQLGPRTDVFALGRVIESLVGPAARTWPPLEEALARATAEASENRFATARDLGRALESCLNSYLARQRLDASWLRSWRREPSALFLGALWSMGHGIGVAAAFTLGPLTPSPGALELLAAMALVSGLAACRFFRVTTRADVRAVVRRTVWAGVPFWLVAWGLSIAGLGGHDATVEQGFKASLQMLALAGFSASLAGTLLQTAALIGVYPRAWHDLPDVTSTARIELTEIRFFLPWRTLFLVLFPALAAAIQLWSYASIPTRERMALARYQSLVEKTFTRTLERHPTAAESDWWSMRFASVPEEHGAFACLYYKLLTSTEARRRLVATWMSRLPSERQLSSLSGADTAEAVSRLRAGSSEVRVLTWFLVDKSEHLDEAKFRELVFRFTFGRSPNIGEMQKVAGAESRSDFAELILRRDERSVALLSDWFERYLGRAFAADRGAAVWLHPLRLYGDEAAVLSAILASNEYSGIYLEPFSGLPNPSRCAPFERSVSSPHPPSSVGYLAWLVLSLVGTVFLTLFRLSLDTMARVFSARETSDV